MRRLIERIGWVAPWLLFAAGALPASDARAQTSDMREIFPYLMLVIDTSGSMERLPDCVCETTGCEECLPNCDLANDLVTGLPPKDADGKEQKKNRWAVTLEALTGEFEDFECTQLTRTSSEPFSYDIGYYLPYHQPWDCTAAGACDYSDTTNNTLRQKKNGILDEYRGRINFGLMTFDGWDTWVGKPPLVPVSDFQANLALSEGEPGLWSYGGAKRFHYPNCETDYMMDTGARSAVAEQGSLVSINSCKAGGPSTCPDWCTKCWVDDPTEIVTELNADIQNQLLATRPYGGTPIAASLDDLYTHLRTLPDDFAGCRRRFGLLMTDGYPDDDYRSLGCNCKNEGSPTITLTTDGGMTVDGGTDPAYAWRCGDPTKNDPEDMACPYPTPEQAAFDLVHGRAATNDPAQLERLFVVGLAVDDDAVLNRLDAIADNGCTDEMGCEVDGHEAFFADDVPSLISTLSDVIEKLTDPISRSIPTFANANPDRNTDPNTRQFQISTGFRVPVEADEPWKGLIERSRFTCDGPVLEEVDVEDEDELHNVINAQAVNTPTYLQTALPETGSQNEHIYGKTGGTPCGIAGTGELSGCELISLKDPLVTNAVLGLGTTTADDDKHIEINDWMYGENDSRRVGNRLGDIYHSSPVVLGIPRYDTGDEAFNEFRESAVVTDRPLTMFVGTNDGVLRAISLETFTGVTGSLYETDYAAGEQMWGFVPPMMLDRLRNQINGDHYFSMDGTPVVKNVYFSRATGATATAAADNYHTVLITGMRGGGNGYIALDVTNPTAPQFLWQFTDPDMGKTYAQAGIAHATWIDGSGNPRNSAIAILPGGVGEPETDPGDCPDGSVESMRTSDGGEYTSYSTFPGTGDIKHRGNIRCWQPTGRAIYFIDIETGELLKKIYRDTPCTTEPPTTTCTGALLLPSPMVSTPAIFQSDIGTRASRAFLADADGVIWRIDMTSTNIEPNDPMAGWTVRPFHDMFWADDGTPQAGTPTNGEASYEAPILSVDPLGRVVVIAATGDTDNFVKSTVQNRVVSLTEVIETGPTAPTPPENFHALLNWEKRQKTVDGFYPSELTTGPMALFAGQLFFSTFISVSNAADKCEFGKGRIHAVHYIDRNTSDANGTNPQTYGPALITTAAADTNAQSIINVDLADAESNLMLLGLTITQRPNCEVADPSLSDPWSPQSIPTYSQLNDPALYLVAQGGGDHGSGSMLKSKTQGGLLGVQLKINRAKSPTRVVSWATSVD